MDKDNFDERINAASKAWDLFIILTSATIGGVCKRSKQISIYIIVSKLILIMSRLKCVYAWKNYCEI